MSLTLTCHSCQQVLSADTEDELVTLGQQHAAQHGHTPPQPRDHVLARIRRHNRSELPEEDSPGGGLQRA